MTTDTTNDTPQPESTPRREATPRTWLGRIARRKRMLALEQWRRLDDDAREGISDEDYATTMATLEAMARNLGWDESQAGDEARGHGGHHGRWHGQGCGHGQGHKGHHGHRHHGRCAERATVEA
ncbi:MAG: hypothetical protein ACO1N6_09305 [Microcella sp.]